MLLMHKRKKRKNLGHTNTPLGYGKEMVYPQNLKGLLRFIAWQSFRPLNGSHFFRDGSRLPSYYSKLVDSSTYGRVGET